jgi:hypothetical protein
MSGTGRTSEAQRMDRRSFITMGFKTVGALAALPTASALLSGCGGGEETSKPSSSAPQKGSAAKPDAAPVAPQPKAPEPAAAPAEGGERALVTEVEAMRPTAQALKYTSESTQPDQHCSNCLFYTAADGGLGKCQLFPQGYVAERGWCSSWSAKPAA